MSELGSHQTGEAGSALLDKLMYTAKFLVLVLVGDCHYTLLDPQVLKIPPALTCDQLIPPLSKGVPCLQIRKVLLRIRDPIEDFSRQYHIPKAVKIGIYFLLDFGWEIHCAILSLISLF